MLKQQAFALIFTLLIIPFISKADGLADLNRALTLLNNNNPITATLTATNYYQQGEGKEKVVRNGKAEIILNDSDQGLQITYSKEILSKLELESRQRIKNEDADTPTLNAIDSNRATELKSTLSAAPGIERTLAQATFLSEEQVIVDEKTLRQLNFELPVSSIIRDKRTRKYVKKFQSQYSVIISDTGVPLTTELTFSGRGRAYLVLSVKADGYERTTYQVVNQRLVKISNEGGSKFDSTFGYTERKNSERLTVPLIPKKRLADELVAIAEQR